MDKIKKCSKCNRIKNISLFFKDSDKKDKLRSICKNCDKNRNKLYYNENKDKILKWQIKYQKINSQKVNEKNKNWRDKNKLKVKISKKKYHLKSSYGISLEQKLEMIKNQNHKCANIGCSFKFIRENLAFVDHCHITGKIRELLCNNCNAALGFLKENIKTIDGLKSYIRKHK